MDGTDNNQTVYFDYLRVFASLAVMVLHVSASNWRTTDVNGLQWQTFNFFDSIVRWSVPVFVMISGALFLGKDIPLKKMYSKYIIRMVVSFAVWAVIYALFDDGSLEKKVSAIIKGHYHMWFIFMIVGIYMCMPFIKPIVQTNSRMKYYLLLSFIFAFAIPEIVTLSEDFGGEFIKSCVNTIRRNAGHMNMHIVLGYTGYFVLGYYLHRISLSGKQRAVIYVLGVIGAAFTVGMDLIVALRTQKYCDHYYGYLNVNVLFEAVAVYTWFRYSCFNNDRINSFIQMLSKYSYGAYLMHVLIIERLNPRFGISTLSFHPAAAVIFISIMVFVLSFTASALLNHIPIVKKYMV